MNIPFCKPTFGNEEIRAVTRVIKSGWWTTGEEARKFEEEFASYVGSKYAVFVNSGTAALQLSIQWHKTHSNIDSVYVPSLTFTAVSNEAYHAGLTIVWGDVEPETLCLAPINLTEKDIAIPVHLTGRMARILYNVPVIEDSAHLIEKNQCKNNKNLTAFSFYATKNMSTGEGGMIATNIKTQYDWFVKARHHGIDRGPGTGPLYDVDFIGWKSNQSDILAAVGRAQLKKLPEFTEKRRELVKEYNKILDGENYGAHLYPILVHNRPLFLKKMQSAGIQCSVHFRPLHKMTAYNSIIKLPVTELVSSMLVSLPLYPTLTKKEVRYVCKNVLETELMA